MCGFLPASDSLPIFPASEHKPLAGVSDHRKSQDIIDSLRRKVCMSSCCLILAKPLILYLLRITAQGHVVLCKAALACSVCVLLVLYNTAHISMVVNICCALSPYICLGCSQSIKLQAWALGQVPSFAQGLRNSATANAGIPPSIPTTRCVIRVLFNMYFIRLIPTACHIHVCQQ
jgi:hypothetical protein